ncbi:hypothetical protein CPLU01_14328 [Colletotrichum plurivorum]|uniref:DNA ligase D 3'-phosphoesterase domain-containing protein n=1 Tax=Colletotrichum plurivorum TaxID=2175906 RepID=A0A8H6MZG1_9PEZI|nr:hypothetical protein CPLU01_14328 [Colletotrichum plurivorum]
MVDRSPGPGLIPNPFIKKKNLEWSLEVPSSLSGAEKSHGDEDEDEDEPDTSDRTPPGHSAALESGSASIPDPAAHFFSHLARHTLSPYPSDAAHLPADEFRSLFERSAGSRDGAHFVVHQHDHPIAGTHYDLRLQINPTSSVSWAVMYGLPGDANSVRLNRNATETRVHCLWNHVVETASRATGSLVVWDTGRYEVLRRKDRTGPSVDPDSEEENEGDDGGTEQERLARAFGERKIRVRLWGSKLPKGYVLNLRLTKGEDLEGRRKSERTLGRPARKRRRGGGKKEVLIETSEEEGDEEGEEDVVPDPSSGAGEGEKGLTDVDRELRELEDEVVRQTNAYKGAENSVGSVHQRRWYLSLDREASGFVRKVVDGKRVWVPKEERVEDSNESGRLRFPFYVGGPDVERSVVTGRLGQEVLWDEGVTGFVKRKGWKPVLN